MVNIVYKEPPLVAKIKIDTNELDAILVATVNDLCPDGYYFLEIPPGHTWDGTKIVKNPNHFGLLNKTNTMDIL